jgi:hypothetical protein
MNEKVVIITPPDDTFLNGLRIFLFDLTNNQSETLSKSILELDLTDLDIIIYKFQTENDIEWFFDKIHKCDLFIFNADSINQTIVGYLAHNSNSYYFGDLRDLYRVNNRVLYKQEDCVKLLNLYTEKYER